MEGVNGRDRIMRVDLERACANGTLPDFTAESGTSLRSAMSAVIPSARPILAILLPDFVSSESIIFQTENKYLRI